MSKIKMNNKKKQYVEEVFNEFLDFKEIQNLSPQTIIFYKNNTNRFFKFLSENDIKEIADIDKNVLKEFKRYLINELDNVVTINTYLRSTRVFLRYCMSSGYIQKFKIKLLKSEDKIKEIYTDEELNKLLQKPNIQECNFASYRNWVITCYLVSTGNRSKTIRNIKLKDLDLKNGYVKLTTMKNRNQQIVPLSKTMMKILKEYLKYRGGEPDDYLFCTECGDKFTRQGLYTAIKNYNLDIGVNKTSLHLYRNVFAKKYLKSGGDIYHLQRLLNHKSLEMVREYLNLYKEDLKENYDKLNPLEQLNRKERNVIDMDN